MFTAYTAWPEHFQAVYIYLTVVWLIIFSFIFVLRVNNLGRIILSKLFYCRRCFTNFTLTIYNILNSKSQL